MSKEPQAVGLDLSASIPAQTAWIDICYQGTTKPTGWRIELAGPAHPKTIAAAEETSREQLDREKAIEFAQVNGRKFKKDNETVAERREKVVRSICRRIVGWEPPPKIAQFSDGPIAFSEETATKLFLEPYMSWAFGQITDYILSETAFTQRSAAE